MLRNDSQWARTFRAWLGMTGNQWEWLRLPAGIPRREYLVRAINKGVFPREEGGREGEWGSKTIRIGSPAPLSLGSHCSSRSLIATCKVIVKKEKISLQHFCVDNRKESKINAWGDNSPSVYEVNKTRSVTQNRNLIGRFVSHRCSFVLATINHVSDVEFIVPFSSSLFFRSFAFPTLTFLRHFLRVPAWRIIFFIS